MAKNLHNEIFIAGIDLTSKFTSLPYILLPEI